MPITESLGVPGAFWTFNREERNAVAILTGLLTRPDNLHAFARILDWRPGRLDDVEFSVEWTFLRDLWNFHSRSTSADGMRLAILDSLRPSNREELEACSVHDFNSFFGAVPRPSSTFVQSPGNWSVARFDPHIADHHEFRSTCRFKWAFNVKPDLVLQTPDGQVLCVEAKWDSAEGQYPASEVEKAIFGRRGLSYVSQTEVQRYLVNELLGFEGTLVYLARRQVSTEAGRCVTWSDPFVRHWCEQEIGSQS